MFEFIKKWALKQAVKSIIKKLPIYKNELSELVKNNLDEVLDKVEKAIKETLLNLIAKKANKWKKF